MLTNGLLAHSFGKRYELPLPLWVFVVGGAAVVLVSFALIARPTAVTVEGAEPVDGTHLRKVSPGPAVAGVVGLAVLLAAGLLGSQEVSENILPTVFWLLIWIVVPLSCALVGDWTQPLNAMATLARWTDSARLRRRLLGNTEPLSWPRWLGWWPAVLVYFLAACGELIFNETATLPRVTAGALLVYAVFSAFLAVIFGRSWRERGEVFTVLFATWGRLGYFRFGSPGPRGFAGGLRAGFERSVSRLLFVLLMLVNVSFDGLLATPAWTTARLRLSRYMGPQSAEFRLLTTLAFIAMVVAAWLLFSGFAWAAFRVGGRRMSATSALSDLLPSLVPIAFGYLLAHNLQYVLVNSQLMLPLLGNPVGRSGWPIHLPYPFNDEYEPNRGPVPSAAYWYIAVAAILTAHIYAIVLSHGHLAAKVPDPRRARNAELPWLTVMVAYTMLSLWLLAQPLVEAPHSAGEAALTSDAVTAMQAGAAWR